MKTPKRAWLVVVLCGCAGALFFLDRHTLSVLKTTLKFELGWTDVDYGWLVTTFMACYSGFYFVTGRIIDRYGTRIMMPAFLTVMSLATIGCGLVTSIHAMAILRAVLGLAGAGILPAILVAIFRWFPANARGTAATIKEPFYIAGQVLATPLAVWVCLKWSWHTAFFIPGVLGLFVAAAWWWVDNPAAVGGDPAGNGHSWPRVSYRALLSNPEYLRVVFARVITDPVWFFYVYWEPAYLREDVGLSFGRLGRLGWIPTAAATACIFVLAALSDRYVRTRGWRPAYSRRYLIGVSTLLAPSVLALAFVHQPLVSLILLSLARSMMVGWLSLTNLLAADLVPENQTGSAVALVSAFGGAAALLASLGLGRWVHHSGYAPVFAAGACLYPVAWLVLRAKTRKPDPSPGPASILGYAYKLKAGKP